MHVAFRSFKTQFSLMTKSTTSTPPTASDQGPRGVPSHLRTAVELIAVLTLALGMLGLAALFLAVLYSGHLESRWTPIFERQFLAIVGIPVSGLSAVTIVQFFRGFHGPIEFNVGPVKFTGATGPVVLWLFCFVAFIWAMRYLWSV